jgi:thiamine biosynthesis protein ThiS
MQITVNGEQRTVDDGATVADLIELLGLARAICAAEVNKAVVPRDKRPETPLREGDVVEVVTLVGGG